MMRPPAEGEFKFPVGRAWAVHRGRSHLVRAFASIEGSEHKAIKAACGIEFIAPLPSPVIVTRRCRVCLTTGLS